MIRNRCVRNQVLQELLRDLQITISGSLSDIWHNTYYVLHTPQECDRAAEELADDEEMLCRDGRLFAILAGSVDEYVGYKTTLKELDMHRSREVFRRNTQENVIDRDVAEDVIR